MKGFLLLVAAITPLIIIQPTGDNIEVPLEQSEEALTIGPDGTVTVRIAENLNLEPDDPIDPDPGPEPPDPLDCTIDHTLTKDRRASYRIGGYGPWASSTSTLWVNEPGGSNPQFVGVKQGQYAALEFTTGGVTRGSTSFEEATYLPTASRIAVSISRCPGVFDPARNGTACGVATRFPTLLWEVGTTDSDFYCQLETNTTYYMNIANANSLTPPGLNNSTCNVPECARIYVHRDIN